MKHARLYFENNILLETDNCVLWPYARRGPYGEIRVNGRTIYTHQYSALRRLGPCPIGKESCHICANKLCFNYRHLEYKTHRENILDRKRDGTNIGPRGESCGYNRLTENHIHWIRQQFDIGFRQKKIAEHLQIPIATINNIRRNGCWSWLPIQNPYVKIWKDLTK